MTTVIITGASSGLGREYAKLIAKKYKDVESFWLIARRSDRLEALAEEIGKEKCFILPLDLTEDASFGELKKVLDDTCPEIKILINNAGFGKMGDFLDVPTTEHINQIKVNCISLTAVTSLCLPYMQNGGEIINVASIAAFSPNPRLAVYSSTKAYVYSFSRALREELKGKGINVLAVCPGPMDTEFLNVANIFKGNSKMFDSLPRVKTSMVVKKSLKKSAKKQAVSTNKFLYRLYHLLCKILPEAILLKIGKV